MRAGLAQKEPLFLKQWEKSDLYAQIRKKQILQPPRQSKKSKIFTLHDGPPYANGDIHIGHALNKILKDVIVKMKTMQGFDSLYVPGWDCHGLPIEHKLFKELKKKKREVDCLEFRKKAHDYALKYVAIQKEQFKRLGIFGQWDNPYLTLSPEYEYWILQSFARLARDGYIYRGLKPVNWCAQCETALAEAEVEYEDHTSPSVYVKFRVNNPQDLKGYPDPAGDGAGGHKYPDGKPLYLLVWTTTPWTLLANVAVAVHHAYSYSLVETDNEILIVESSLKDSVFNKREASGEKSNGTTVRECKGDDLKGLVYTLPFSKEDCGRVITVDYVTKEDGTGLVHIAPGHGQEDYEAGIAHHLDIRMPVDGRGVFTKEAGKFEGQHVFKANVKIIEDLRERGMLFASENISHSYPHCWRCKKPIIFRATKQWFLKIDHKGLRGKLKDAVSKDVRWFPPSGQERMLSMVSTRPDWCLSRQRHWGVPIPALACQGCAGEHKLYPKVVEHFAGMVKSKGTDLWFEKDVKQIVPKGFCCPDCGKDDFKKTYDILDVWFDSGVSYQAVVGPMLGRDIPVDLYLEGSDQHRGWFQSSLIPAVAMEGKSPFAGVLTHGFVVDGQGRKMSKSLGNVISPHEIVKTNGVDILRLWVMSSQYNEDVRLSKEILARLIDAYRKIRNTVRFLLGNLNSFDPDKDEVPYDSLLEIDRWALYRLAATLKAVRRAYNDYEFAKVYKMIYAFCNEDLSSFYLDILKDRLYTSPASSRERRSAQTVLYHILNHLVRILAPILTFTAEEIFEAMPKTSQTQKVGSVHLLDWLAIPESWENPAAWEKFKLLIEMRPYVLKALEDKRRDDEIGSSLQAKIIFKSASERDLEYLLTLKDMLPSLFIVSQVEVEKAAAVQKGMSDTFSKTEVVIMKADGEKCSRCWNFSTQVGKDGGHPTLCGRCAAVVETIHA